MKSFLAGLGIGALIGILWAPARGVVTRERLAFWWDDMTSESPREMEKSNRQKNWNDGQSVASSSPIASELIS